MSCAYKLSFSLRLGMYKLMLIPRQCMSHMCDGSEFVSLLQGDLVGGTGSITGSVIGCGLPNGLPSGISPRGLPSGMPTTGTSPLRRSPQKSSPQQSSPSPRNYMPSPRTLGWDSDQPLNAGSLATGDAHSQGAVHPSNRYN